ncbi:MAG: exosortase/archaeosortase family protein [Candidatus Omnitrophica bacterium]|nr:exosortase/archaeosortase family protein [Candidatus Omnitrophota bacterium]
MKAKTQNLQLSNYAPLMVLAVLFLIIYAPIFWWMWERWFARDSYYTHGILVPFVSAYLIWHKRELLKKIPLESSPWGVRLIIFGIIIHFFSAMFRIYFTSGFSMLIVMSGLVLNFYGKRIFKETAFALGFLVFMVPLPMVVVTHISFSLKLYVAHLAAVVLNNIHIPAIEDGSIIKMRHAYVIVDDVCSGLRSLISLTALGSLFAYWMTSSKIKKIILFLTTIPIAVVTNVFRIVLLAVISEVWGVKYASGLLHELSGLSVFALACVLLASVGKLLE